MQSFLWSCTLELLNESEVVWIIVQTETFVQLFAFLQLVNLNKRGNKLKRKLFSSSLWLVSITRFKHSFCYLNKQVLTSAVTNTFGPSLLLITSLSLNVMHCPLCSMTVSGIFAFCHLLFLSSFSFSSSTKQRLLACSNLRLAQIGKMDKKVKQVSALSDYTEIWSRPCLYKQNKNSVSFLLQLCICFVQS